MASKSSTSLPLVLQRQAVLQSSEETSTNPALDSNTSLDIQADVTDARNASADKVSILLANGSIEQQVGSCSKSGWEIYKSRIHQLYILENKTLREVMQQMMEEKGFNPSANTWKRHLADWGMYKYNREKDVAELVYRKQTRDAAGKSSIIFRSGQIVDKKRIYNYLKRKKLSSRDLILRLGNDETIRSTPHIHIRTPSPPRFLHLPGIAGEKQTMLLSMKAWYLIWISKPPPMRDSGIPLPPPSFHLAQDGSFKIVDSIYVLLKRCCYLFRLNHFAEGGTYIRSAFILIELLFGEISRQSLCNKKQSPVWIFGLWKLLSDMPYEIANSFLLHAKALGRQILPAGHPVLDIMQCLCRVHSSTTHDVFAGFISSTWADSVDNISNLLNSSWLTTAAYLPPIFWTGGADRHPCQVKETFMEFRRVEDIETWQQRIKDFAFALCRDRQMFFPAPEHTDILTLMWLRSSSMEGSDCGSLSSKETHGSNGVNEAWAFKSATMTRLELSVGKDSHQGGCDIIRILSGDVYQVGYLHHPRPNEDIQTFKQRTNLGSHGFDKATSLFEKTRGVETGRSAWFQWLQILEESLMYRPHIPRACEEQQAGSVIQHESFRGGGFICNYMATSQGELGNIGEDPKPDTSCAEDGSMFFSHVSFQI